MAKLSFAALLTHPMSINQNSRGPVTPEIDFAMVMPAVSETTSSNQVLISFVRKISIWWSQNVAGHGIHMAAQMWMVQLTTALHTVLLEIQGLNNSITWLISWQNEIYNILLQNYLIVGNLNVLESQSSIEMNDCS